MNSIKHWLVNLAIIIAALVAIIGVVPYLFASIVWFFGFLFDFAAVDIGATGPGSWLLRNITSSWEKLFTAIF